jgi:hypothetical protein
MKTIDLSTGPVEVGELLRLADEDNLILRTADGKEFLLAGIDDDFDDEIARICNSPELMALLEARSKPERTYSLDEARQALGLDED